jgi:hypothetical protein
MAAQSAHRTTADEPDQTGFHEGPTILFTPPAGSPAPRLIRSPVGPPFCDCRVQSMRNGCGAKPLRFRPLDKDDAVPRVRKADGGKCDGGPGRNRDTVQRSLRWLSRADVRWAHDSVRPPTAGSRAPRLIRFLVGLTQVSPLSSGWRGRPEFHPVRVSACLHYLSRCFRFGRDLLLISVVGALPTMAWRLDFRTSIWPILILASKQG